MLKDIKTNGSQIYFTDQFADQVKATQFNKQGSGSYLLPRMVGKGIKKLNSLYN